MARIVNLGCAKTVKKDCDVEDCEPQCEEEKKDCDDELCKCAKTVNSK